MRGKERKKGRNNGESKQNIREEGGSERYLEKNNEDREREIEINRDRKRVRSRNKKELIETGEVASVTVVAKEKERN